MGTFIIEVQGHDVDEFDYGISAQNGSTIITWQIQDNVFNNLVNATYKLAIRATGTTTPILNEWYTDMDDSSQSYSILAPGKNLFDKYSVVTGKYIDTTTGALVNNANSAVSPLIPITAGETYYLSGRNSGQTILRFLDSGGTALKPILYSTGLVSATFSMGSENGAVIAPATAVNAQFTVKFTGTGTYDSIQFEHNNVQTDYVANLVVQSKYLQNLATDAELLAVSTVANTASTNATLANTKIDQSQAGLTKRINSGENTSSPNAFPTKSDASAAFGITISADTDSPVKDLVGYKRTFLTTLQGAGPGYTSFNTWTLPIGAARPSEIGVAFWTKKTEFQAIYVSNFQSYLGLCTFSLNPTAAFSGTPVVANGSAGSSVELTSAKLQFSVIAEVGAYVRINLKYYDLVWKGSFVGTTMTYYYLFNGSDANSKPLTFIDFTCLLGEQPVQSLVYPDNSTLIGSPTLKSTYDLGLSNTRRIETIERGGVRLKKVGNTLYIASAWNSTYDLVKQVLYIRSSSYTNNPTCNFVNEYLCVKDGDPAVNASTIKSSSDDICPAHVNSSYIGGNHSWNQGYSVTMTGHGKTVSDIGSIYKNGSGVEFTILRVVDSNVLWMASKNQAVDGFTYTFIQPSGTLTYFSSGTNTSDIVVAASASLGNTYTTVLNSVIKVYIDGVTEITTDGTFYGRFFDIIESYDILDFPSLVNQLIANRPGGGYVSAPQLNTISGVEKLFNHSISYRFTKNGNTVVSTTFRAYKKLKISFHGFIQAEALTTGNIYCPKSLPISDGVTTFDLRQITNWTSPPVAPLNLISTYWEKESSPPDRIINMNASANLHYGYITDRGIGMLRLINLYNSMFLNTSRKIYPMGINYSSLHTVEANEFYSMIAFRSFTNPSNNPAGRTNYTYVEVGQEAFIFLDYHGALSDFITPEPNWVGRKIEVYEKNNQCTLLCDIVAGMIEVLSTATSTNYGYIVLRLI